MQDGDQLLPNLEVSIDRGDQAHRHVSDLCQDQSICLSSHGLAYKLLAESRSQDVQDRRRRGLCVERDHLRNHCQGRLLGHVNMKVPEQDLSHVLAKRIHVHGLLCPHDDPCHLRENSGLVQGELRSPFRSWIMRAQLDVLDDRSPDEIEYMCKGDAKALPMPECPRWQRVQACCEGCTQGLARCCLEACLRQGWQGLSFEEFF